MCLVDIILDNTIHHDIVCHIRGKFRNKNKNNNLVSIHSILLVGIRQWTNQLNACDLLFVYSHHHINSLPISLFTHNSIQHNYNSFQFSNDNATHDTINHQQLHNYTTTMTSTLTSFRFERGAMPPFNPPYCVLYSIVLLSIEVMLEFV